MDINETSPEIDILSEPEPPTEPDVTINIEPPEPEAEPVATELIETIIEDKQKEIEQWREITLETISTQMTETLTTIAEMNRQIAQFQERLNLQETTISQLQNPPQPEPENLSNENADAPAKPKKSLAKMILKILT